jgi:cell wall-associated NlpC family hydrolase
LKVIIKLKRSHRKQLNRSEKILFTILLSLTLAAPSPAETIPPIYAVAVFPTPVLNTPDFKTVFGGRDGKTLHLDTSGLVREVEFVAIPGTVFHIEDSLKESGQTIYRVTTDEYPYPTRTGYFIDSRFVKTNSTPPSPRPKLLPSKQTVTDNLLAARGSIYVWGGNIRAGIPQQLQFYPPATNSILPVKTLDMWQLRGVDCSGLLYEATDGYTPRNTSSLVTYGNPVRIAGMDTDSIIRRLEPLDLIVWSGHVMIVLDRKREIESRLDKRGNGGVVVRPLREALNELLKSRVPLDDYPTAAANWVKGFVIRRWYPAGGQGQSM